jgi:hypothetical protein
MDNVLNKVNFIARGSITTPPPWALRLDQSLTVMQAARMKLAVHVIGHQKGSQLLMGISDLRIEGPSSEIQPCRYALQGALQTSNQNGFVRCVKTLAVASDQYIYLDLATTGCVVNETELANWEPELIQAPGHFAIPVTPQDDRHRR